MVLQLGHTLLLSLSSFDVFTSADCMLGVKQVAWANKKTKRNHKQGNTWQGDTVEYFGGVSGLTVCLCFKMWTCEK